MHASDYIDQRRDILIRLLICKRVGYQQVARPVHVRNALLMLVAGVEWRYWSDSELCVLDSIEDLPTVWSAEREGE